jgi:hypothetical protein
MIAKTLAAGAGVLVVAVMSACHAQATPAKFPDLASLTPVNVSDYAVDASTPGMPATQVYFRTPDGVTCEFLSGQAQCIGNNIPGLPPASPTSKGAPRVNWIGTSSGLKPAAPVEDRSSGIKILPPLHSITVDGVVCGIDGSGTTACKDPQGRGFILSPSWSGWLPHV